MFITFEGGEGCGKSTHSRLLKKYLERKGHRVILTLEPGGTDIGGKIRHMLLKGKKLVSRYSELFLFAADRAEHVARIIRPALIAGKIVISDRYVDSTTAYQEGGRRLPKDLIDLINKVSSESLVPDITFLLDVRPGIGIRRGTRHTGKDKFESENRGFHDRVRKTYLRLAKKEKNRIKLISTDDAVEKVQSMIREIVDEKLADKG